jgi:hypothetical protein
MWSASADGRARHRITAAEYTAAMRLVHLGFALLAAGAAFSASARGWQGLTPGANSEADVIARFGQPSTRGRVGGRLALVYKDEQAIGSTRQAQFYLRDDGTLSEIVVFPTSQLDREAVQGTYGPPTRKAFTDDFRMVWIFRATGITVYFGKDSFVDAISFKAPSGAAGAEPRAEGTAPRAPPRGQGSGRERPAPTAAWEGKDHAARR